MKPNLPVPVFLRVFDNSEPGALLKLSSVIFPQGKRNRQKQLSLKQPHKVLYCCAGSFVRQSAVLAPQEAINGTSSRLPFDPKVCSKLRSARRSADWIGSSAVRKAGRRRATKKQEKKIQISPHGCFDLRSRNTAVRFFKRNATTCTTRCRRCQSNVKPDVKDLKHNGHTMHSEFRCR